MRMYITLGYDEGQTIEQAVPYFASPKQEDARDCAEHVLADYGVVIAVDVPIADAVVLHISHHPAIEDRDDGPSDGAIYARG